MEEPIFSDEYAPGEIAKQDPEEGEFRKGENTVIQVWISAGEDLAKMPDVVDVAENLATVQLKKLKEKYNLIIEVREEDRQFHDEIDAGNIISTIPVAGESLKKGDTIRLIVSKGPQTYPLPPFTNIPLDAAWEQVVSLGFNKGEVEYVFSDLPEGYVVEQDPAANDEVPNGTVVNFKVSKGKDDGSGSYYPGTDTVVFSLPAGLETGTLKVYQDRRLIFNNVIDCTPGSFALEVSASGETAIEAYLDGELIYDKIITIEEYYE